MRVLILTLGLLSALAYADTLKPAVIELEKLVNEVEDGRAAKAKLQVEFKKKQKMLDDKQAELKKLEDSIRNPSAAMKEEARQAKADEFQEKLADVQQLFNTTQQDMVKRQQEVMLEIVKKAEPIIQDIAKKEGFDIVLNKTPAVVVYAKPELNITDIVLKRYNASYPATKALPAPKKKK